MSHHKSTALAASFAFAAVLFAGAPAFAAEGHDHAMNAQSTDSADSAKAAYPLTTCVVSGDKLVGDMGGPIDYIYKEAGKPDRLVRFCCKDCIKDFEKEPAKYLKKIDEAAVAKAKPAEPKH